MNIRRTTLALAGGALALTLAACGSGESPAQSAGSAPNSGAPSSGANQRGPAASGTIAQLTGQSMEVQNPSSGQVTVNFSNTTTFTNRVTAALSDVTTGSCVVVQGTGTPLAAKSVEISAPDANGSCTGGFGGGMRPQNGGQSRAPRPSGSPRPSGANGPGRGGAFGKVTAVSPTGFTVEQDNRQSGATSSTPVTVDSTTTYTKTATADANALKVGECVSATGQADDTGAVAAKTIMISQPGPNGCQTFGGGRGRNGAGNGDNGGGNGNG